MTQAMICAPQPEAVEAGAEVLRQGGNAIDAAIWSGGSADSISAR